MKMNKLRTALVAVMFGLGSVTAFAADPPKTDEQRKEARDMKAAKAKEAREAKEAKKKEAREKRAAAAKERSEMKKEKK